MGKKIVGLFLLFLLSAAVYASDVTVLVNGQQGGTIDAFKGYKANIQVSIKNGPPNAEVHLDAIDRSNFVTNALNGIGEVLGIDTPMHKYAVQITVADERDGALSGSTLKEACSWGKVDTTWEQMVYAEATLAMPLVVGYAYHKKAHAGRKEKRCADLFATVGAR